MTSLSSLSSPSSRRALIVGGSLGGLFAANLLARTGWDVQVFEKTSEALGERGAGIVTHEELFEALRRAHIPIDDSIGVKVAGRVTLAREGTVIDERALPQILTAWGRLYRLLLDGFGRERYRFGRSLARVEQDEQRVAAVFEDGERIEADILIAADGIRSTVRVQYAPEIAPLYAGYIAWRGLAEERALSPATHAMLFERFGFSLPPGEQMLGYPVAGANDSTAPGERRYNFVWYRPADEATELPRLLTDREGRTYAGGIPPEAIRPEVVARMRADADALLAPQFAEVVRATSQPFMQPIYDLESTRLVFGRVMVLGDAAFVARPHVGMGVTKAAGDAMALAEELNTAGELGRALARFEARRLGFGASIVARARHLGAYMQAQIKTAEEREMAERFRTPAAVMRETAVTPTE